MAGEGGIKVRTRRREASGHAAAPPNATIISGRRNEIEVCQIAVNIM
jgi:hypothetical protein